MKNARKSPWRLLYKLHRYLGLAVSVILILLAITGIALNHTDDWQLNSRYIKSPTLLNWYGLNRLSDIRSYKVGPHWISQLDQQSYFNTQALTTNNQLLVGAISTEPFIVLAFEKQLLLISDSGSIIEKIPLETPVHSIGVTGQDTVFIRLDTQIKASHDGLLSWQTVSDPSVLWSQETTLTEPLSDQLQQTHRQHIIPYERFLLDLHSGRLFGPVGIFIVDLSGILLILLSVSGCWIWIRHRLKSRFHNKRLR
jgi:hypothetical protein